MNDVLEEPKTDHLFSIYGHQLQYSASGRSLVEPVQELLRHFHCGRLEHAPSLTVQFHAVTAREAIPWSMSASARSLASGTGEAVGDRRATGLPYEVFRDTGKLVVEFPDIGVLVIDEAQGKAEGYLIDPDRRPQNLIEYLFHLALIELLRRLELYTIHATALEYHGKGILIPGNSGRGKTTSFISLLRSGYRYLSDDHPLLRDAGTHVEVLPFPIKINVTEATREFFPELKTAPDSVLRDGMPKRWFYAEDLYQTEMGKPCPPSIVFFPHVTDAPRSHLELLPKSRALEALLPQTLLVYDQASARRQFQVLARLVQQVDCYRLYFGRDVLDLPKLITPLLEATR